jgi:FlaA1/EpsC-like NDP-sugar epimerase
MRRAAPSGCAGVCGSTGDGGCVDIGAAGGNSPSIRTGRIFDGQTGRIFSGQAGRIFSGQRWGRSGVEAGYDSAAWLGGLLAAEWVTRVPARAGLSPAGLAQLTLIICLLSTGSGLLAGLYRGRYQRGSLDEVVRVGLACCGMAVSLAASGFALFAGQRAEIETAVGGALFALPAMLGARYVLFAVRQRSRAPATAATEIIVFGAGEAGSILVHRLTCRPDAQYRPVAILDDDPAKRRLRIQGIPVLGDRSRMAEVAARTGATVLVIAIAEASGKTIRDLTVEAENCGLTPKVIPSITEMLNGGARIEGVRDPRISDLLGRRPVKTDVATVTGHFAGKRILVTGAGGSIGSELCRQLHQLHPAELIMLDRDESALHAMQLTLHGRALLDTDDTVLADIRDPRRITEVFEQCRPQIVFHAAALKHLPLLERYPAEALKSNVWGTLTVLEAAAASGVESFVNISTDKAADPVSVLGYSKRIGERLTAYLAGRADGTYLSVRFGNVLGSRGSVLTALSAQVAAGGPVTVTHPKVSRYFMTADEAVQLVLQAAVIGDDGEVLVLDTGERVLIDDIARRLAARAAVEIDIVYTGLRPGEKLTEVLLGRDELDAPRPHHSLIRHAAVAPLHPDQVSGLDPEGGAEYMRAALACCAGYVSPDLARSGTEGLGLVRAIGPAERHQSPHQPVEQCGGVGIRLRRTPDGVGHVVVQVVPEKRSAVPGAVGAVQPSGQRLASLPGPDRLPAPDYFLQGERARPDLRQRDHGLPDVRPGHPDDQVGPDQVSHGELAAAVRSGVEPVGGHGRDRLGRWPLALSQQSGPLYSGRLYSGRANRSDCAAPGQPAREQRLGHRGPAGVSGAKHQNVGHGKRRMMTIPSQSASHRHDYSEIRPERPRWQRVRGPARFHSE